MLQQCWKHPGLIIKDNSNLEARTEENKGRGSKILSTEPEAAAHLQGGGLVVDVDDGAATG